MHARRRQTVEQSSSANAGEDVIIGVVDRAFGVHGAALVTSLTDVPERYQVGMSVRLADDRGLSYPTTILSVRPHGERLIVEFDGIKAPETLARYRGAYVYAPRSAEPAPDGHFFQCDLLGLGVVDEQGRSLGAVDHIVESGTQHLFVVRGGEREWLIPAVKAWVTNIDLAARTMTVRRPEVDESARDDARQAAQTVEPHAAEAGERTRHAR
ncbi:MAG: ribosome maturation factor RimM [Nitrospiraceae bacterium]